MERKGWVMVIILIGLPHRISTRYIDPANTDRVNINTFIHWATKNLVLAGHLYEQVNMPSERWTVLYALPALPCVN